MKIKKYLVYTMQEGLAQVKKELGPEAVIIESKKKRQKGFMGFFLPRLVEITAAVDRTEPQAEQKKQELYPLSSRVDTELNQLKEMMNRLLVQQESSRAEGNGLSGYWLKRLTRNDVLEEAALDIIASVRRSLDGRETTSEAMESLVAGRIRDIVKVAPIPLNAKYISFVGPTGVGKTTTLAKLAAQFGFEQQKKTAIITVDTYRIGAVDQLKTYAGITGIPVEVVYNPAEMKQAVKKFRQMDVVLVDTAGRSSKNALQIAETARYLETIPDGIVFLVLSATTKSRDLEKIVTGFKMTGCNRLIVTKLDETDSYGVFLNLCRLTNLPVSYVTTGQNVPDDIEAAEAGKLTGMVLGED